MTFGAGDGGGPVGHQKGDQFGHLGGLGGAADGDAAEGIHHLVERGLPVDPGADGDALDEAIGPGRLDEAAPAPDR